ncbi:MAG: TetR/AcrR family transcriptional regulator, ethionamide resistance regulator [Kribbellaceae bacterium]|nr:TetR/AcrR family transcriptional regulator, ethionamide resistance regulator [Kribbellaceae bacterium]
MRRGRRAPRVTGDDRERAILAAAQRLLEEKPLQEISIEDLTQAVGISRPAFYFYFASKDAVVLTLLDRMVDASFAAVEEKVAAAEGDPVERWRSAIQAAFRTFSEHRTVVHAAAQLKAGNPEIQRLWTSILERWVHRTMNAIEAERQRGAAPAGLPARQLAVALNLMSERAMTAISTGEQPTLPEAELVDILTQVWVNAIYLTPTPQRYGQAAK